MTRQNYENFGVKSCVTNVIAKVNQLSEAFFVFVEVSLMNINFGQHRFFLLKQFFQCLRLFLKLFEIKAKWQPDSFNRLRPSPTNRLVFGIVYQGGKLLLELVVVGLWWPSVELGKSQGGPLPEEPLVAAEVSGVDPAHGVHEDGPLLIEEELDFGAELEDAVLLVELVVELLVDVVLADGPVDVAAGVLAVPLYLQGDGVVQRIHESVYVRAQELADLGGGYVVDRGRVLLQHQPGVPLLRRQRRLGLRPGDLRRRGLRRPVLGVRPSGARGVRVGAYFQIPEMAPYRLKIRTFLTGGQIRALIAITVGLQDVGEHSINYIKEASSFVRPIEF